MAADFAVAPEALTDIADAYAWHEQRRIGLGEGFLTAVDACFASIRRMPEAFARVRKNYRRCHVRRFPYSVFYASEAGAVTVYCVIHNARTPGKWRDRLP